LPLNQLLNKPNPLQNLLLPHASRLLALLRLPVSSYLPGGLFRHGATPATPCQLWPHSDSCSGGAHAPSLWAETKPTVYSVNGEWRFHVAESVPVPVNESDLEIQDLYPLHWDFNGLALIQSFS
jgi:hypothetical protein